MKLQPMQIRNVFLMVIFALVIPNTTSAKCVYLQPLKIKAMELGNMLAWSTAEEQDIKMFVIEKSLNGIDFKRAGDVKGAGYSNSKKTYRFLDFALPEKKTYYRMLHYASDGSFTISETFYIEQSPNQNWSVSSVNSTLTNEELNLTLKSKVETTVFYEVKSRTGKLVKTGETNLVKGNNVIAINCQAFAEGQYDVFFKTGREKASISIKKVTAPEMPNLEYAVVNP